MLERMLFVGNQGGAPVLTLNCAIAREWVARRSNGMASFLVWFDREADQVRQKAPFAEAVHSYEQFLRERSGDWRRHIDRLVREYAEVNWAAVVASERSFVDASFLLGGAGHRVESVDYVLRILTDMVRCFETILSKTRFDAVVCQTADSLFTHVLIKVARHFGQPILAIKPMWLSEDGEPGFCLTSDEFTHAPMMIRAYRELAGRALTQPERDRAERLRADILGYDFRRNFAKAKDRRWQGPLSPNIRRLSRYVLENSRIDKHLDYRRFDPIAKIRANLLRLWRNHRARGLLGRADTALPEKFVLLALHFQPEQSTLVGGIFYANQVALAENVAKSLPLGWTLVIKEHPKGRGSRPAWQYRHLASFPNVMFSDAPAKQLMIQAGAVITITGTIAVEAMAADRPGIVLGQCYFDFSEVLYRPASVNELPEVFRKILVEGHYHHRRDRHQLIERALVALAAGYRPGFPSADSAAEIAVAIIETIEDGGATCEFPNADADGAAIAAGA